MSAAHRLDELPPPDPHARIDAGFEASVRRVPDATALVCEGQRWSYAALDATVSAMAARLREAGLGPGDRVGLYLDNGPALVTGLLAVLRAGGTCMTVNPLTRQEKLGQILAGTRATVLLTQATLAPQWQPALAGLPSLRRVWVDGRWPAAGPGTEPPPEGTAGASSPRVEAWATLTAPGAGLSDRPAEAPCGDDLAFISHTSGTTGAPKGVMLGHAGLVHAVTAIERYLGLRPDDVVGCALPLSFNYGLTHLWLAFAGGRPLVLERNAAFPVKLLEVMGREGVSVMPGVPTLWALLAQHAASPLAALPRLRLITNAAAALPVATLQRLRAMWPQAAVVPMYGQTECTRISYLPPGELDARPTSVGRGMPGQDCWLEDAEGRRLPWGATGELVLEGPHVMLGYWERPAETAAVLRPGSRPGTRVLRTGDQFRSEPEGWLHFVARQDDIIKSRGEKVSPREVEDCIAHLDGVFECAVAGVSDELLGQAVKAWVVPRPGVTLDARAVLRHCQRHLESWMVPKEVVFLDALPKTDTGKTRRADLR